MGNVRGSSTRHIQGIILYGTCRCHCSRDSGSVESIRNYGNSLPEFELEFGIGERTVPALSGFVRMNGDSTRSSIETIDQKAEEFTIKKQPRNLRNISKSG